MKAYLIFRDKRHYSELKYLFPFKIHGIDASGINGRNIFDVSKLGSFISRKIKDSLVLVEEEECKIKDRVFNRNEFTVFYLKNQLAEMPATMCCSIYIFINGFLLHKINEKIDGHIVHSKMSKGNKSQLISFDDVFAYEFLSIPLADLPFSEKCVISHRGRAAKTVIDVLTINRLIYCLK